MATKRSKPGTVPQYDRFQQWLMQRIEERSWSQNRLANEIDVFRGTIGRWLKPVDSPAYRRPSVESFIALGEVFNADPLDLMEMAGMDTAHTPDGTSQVQRDCIAIVMALPDNLLLAVYPNLKALLDVHAKTQAQQHASEHEDE